MSAGSWLRSGLMVLVALTVQQTLLVHLTVGRVHPDVMFLVAVAAGYTAGPGRGSAIGFISGLAADLFVPTPFGMTALVGAVLAYCVAVATSSLVRTSLALQVVTGAVGTAAGPLPLCDARSCSRVPVDAEPRPGTCPRAVHSGSRFARGPCDPAGALGCR